MTTSKKTRTGSASVAPKSRKATSPSPAPPSSQPDGYQWEGFVVWLNAVAIARGTGGKAYLAEQLGVSRSCLSQILGRRAGFDEKTVRMMALIETSKAEKYADIAVESVVQYNGLVIEGRRLDGELIYTWRTE